MPYSNFIAMLVGLEVKAKWEEVAFFKIAEGYGGHTQVLALVRHGAGQVMPADRSGSRSMSATRLCIISL